MEILEKKGLVRIDGKHAGYRMEQTCPRCAQRLVFSEKWDAAFCLACNVWIDSRCDDPGCALCRRRPPRPLPASS